MSYAASEGRIRHIGRADAAAGYPPREGGDGEAWLMDAIGHTSPTTARNHDRRLYLLEAYREAYDRVSGDIAAGINWR